MFLNLNTLHFKMTFAIICPNQDFPFNMTNHNIRTNPNMCLWLSNARSPRRM